MPAETVRWVLDQWARCLAQGMEAMAETPPRIEWSPTAPSPEADLLWWEQHFDGLGEAGLWIGAPDALWQALGGGILKAAGIEQVEPAEARSTYLELLSQALASLVHAMTARAGREIVCVRGAENAPPPGDSFAVTVRMGDAPLPPMLLRLASFEPLEPPKPPAQVPAVRAAAPERPEGAMLDVLLDVELPVTVSFGSAQLPLADVLKLTNGSLVELNRMVNEPVQVLVNNCVIARGDVVVVEGNYGVKITEIASRQERLRSLR